MNHNIANPFLYSIDRANRRLINESQLSIKYMIFLFMISALTIVETGIVMIARSRIIDLAFIFIFLIIDYWIWVSIKIAVRENKTLEIFDTKYQDSKFKYQYVNNEKLFSQLSLINIQIGKLIALKEIILTTMIIEAIIITAKLIEIFNIFI